MSKLNTLTRNRLPAQGEQGEEGKEVKIEWLSRRVKGTAVVGSHVEKEEEERKSTRENVESS